MGLLLLNRSTDFEQIGHQFFGLNYLMAPCPGRSGPLDKFTDFLLMPVAIYRSEIAS